MTYVDLSKPTLAEDNTLKALET